MKEEALRRKEEELKMEKQKELQRQAEELEKERLKKLQAEEEEVRLRGAEEAKRLAHLDNLEKERQRQARLDEAHVEKDKEKWHLLDMDIDKNKQRRQISEEEECNKLDGRDGLDLHSSASDEGVLTKDSSTEDLIERGNVTEVANDNESE